MIPLIPGIIGALSMATELFDAGKSVYEAIAGKPSNAESADDLQVEVEALPEDQRVSWMKQASAMIALYRAQTDRLSVEQGEVTAEVLKAIPPESAGKVALMRMTTRPKIVRWLLHVIMIPAYVIFIDGAIALHNLLQSAYGTGTQLDYIATTFMETGSLYLELYGWAAPTAATVIISYMGLREVGKTKGHADDLTVKEATQSVVGLAARVKGLFSK